MNRMNNIELFHEKKNCCGCGACYSICPKNAIKMTEDQNGFIYPQIDKDKCVQCGLCKTVCNYQKTHEAFKPIAGYVATNTNHDQLMKSSSGGAFSAFATEMLQNGGVVYGAAYEMKDGNYTLRHIRIDMIEELPKVQGSKYVQSYIFDVLPYIKKDLESGQKVLFSGTPCQVDALNGYLKKEYDNLYTVDIICHGVPSQKLLNDYIHTLSDSVEAFEFRNKKKGWKDYYISYCAKNKNKNIHCRLSSFYEYFLQGKLGRENCYSCKYACEMRYSDITIGDYWGIEHVHPELFHEKKWRDRIYDGISSILVNTEKGMELVKETASLELVSSDYARIAANNGQLREPSHYSEDREEILKLYHTEGYDAVNEKFNKTLGSKRVMLTLKASIPIGLKKKLKELVGKS